MKINPDDIKSIEACRPNSDDRNAPGFQPVAERFEHNDALSSFADAINRIDSKIAKEIRNVPVPPAFKERLLSSLSEPVVRPQASLLGITRRNWVGLAVGISASAACLLLALALATPSYDQRTEKELIDFAVSEQTAVADDLWLEFKLASPKQKKLLPSGLAKSPSSYGKNSASSPLFFAFRQPKAYLMVLEGKSAIVSRTFPPRPIAGTGGNSGHYFGVWQSGGHIYVLAVEGDKSDFDRLNASTDGLVFNGARIYLPHRHNRNT